MTRLRGVFCLLLGTLGLACAQAADLHFSDTDRILILAPHPDDEALCCSGVIQEAVARHIPLQIVFLTLGDFNKWAFTMYRHSPVFCPKTMRAMGDVRRQEALAASQVLGVSSGSLTFLGYPDYGTLAIWGAHWGPSSAYESPNTRVSAVPYPAAYRPDAPYKGEDIQQDLESALKTFQPTRVFVPHPADLNVDHRALYLFLRLALRELAPDPTPVLDTYLVHRPPPPFFKDQSLWTSFPLSATEVALKKEALKKHRTQMAYSKRFMMSFVKSAESFGTGALEESNVSADFTDWNVTTDSGDLVLAGTLSQKHSASTSCRVAAYGYRRGIAFAKTPKILITFKNQATQIYDQEQPILNSGVRIARDHRRFIIRIPLALLGQPETVFTGCELFHARKPFGWSLLRIVDPSAGVSG